MFARKHHPDTTPQPPTQADILAHVDACIAEETEHALHVARVPEAAEPALRAALALRLRGVRKAVALWQPRPPLASDEAASVYDTITTAVYTEAVATVSVFTQPRDLAAAHTRDAMRGWNDSRKVNRTGGVPLAALDQPFTNENGLRPGEQRVTQTPDGDMILHIGYPRPSQEDERMNQRFFERRAEQQRQREQQQQQQQQQQNGH